MLVALIVAPAAFIAGVVFADKAKAKFAEWKTKLLGSGEL